MRLDKGSCSYVNVEQRLTLQPDAVTERSGDCEQASGQYQLRVAKIGAILVESRGCVRSLGDAVSRISTRA